MLKKTYQTQRLTLRQSEAALAPKVLEFYSRNRDFFRETEPLREKLFYTESFQRRALARDYHCAQKLESLRLWLQLNGDDAPDEVVGMVALNSILFGAFRGAYVSYKMDAGYTGRGLMREALGRLVKIAFEDIELHRLEANIMPRNKKSLRLVEQLGFQNEGLARQYLKINGVWEDHIHMVLLNPQI